MNNKVYNIIPATLCICVLQGGYLNNNQYKYRKEINKRLQEHDKIKKELYKIYQKQQSDIKKMYNLYEKDCKK
jgi:hypothetical protein